MGTTENRFPGHAGADWPTPARVPRVRRGRILGGGGRALPLLVALGPNHRARWSYFEVVEAQPLAVVQVAAPTGIRVLDHSDHRQPVAADALHPAGSHVVVATLTVGQVEGVGRVHFTECAQPRSTGHRPGPLGPNFGEVVAVLVDAALALGGAAALVLLGLGLGKGRKQLGRVGSGRLHGLTAGNFLQAAGRGSRPAPIKRNLRNSASRCQKHTRWRLMAPIQPRK